MPLPDMLQKYGLTLAGVLLGALAGYLYYRFVGCSSGTCPITSNPVSSILYGAVSGGVLFNTLTT